MVAAVLWGKQIEKDVCGDWMAGSGASIYMFFCSEFNLLMIKGIRSKEAHASSISDIV